MKRIFLSVAAALLLGGFLAGTAQADHGHRGHGHHGHHHHHHHGIWLQSPGFYPNYGYGNGYYGGYGVPYGAGYIGGYRPYSNFYYAGPRFGIGINF